MPKRLKIFFDGGCRPNPGPMEAAVVARGVTHYFDDLGDGTNNDAEWLALIAALRVAQRLGVTDFVLLGDSALVVAQANGRQRCRTPALQAHLDAFEVIGDVRTVRVRKIARSQNLAGIALDRRRHAAGIARAA
ncbi:reverse transcriptase-like protein [Sphingomonas sp. SUN039]|uniref:reverse transcriptase-like protein n=1 Tax=Sphingomonas sp. SUN039 TaxID=2937787 RepID=UPI002164ED40|nr:reverse transcriptase-like protein [Sphingomonas sp. SUN039]UVO52694.1 reverse transcriptase-like protein [Sphingomonas sp. SUN039]